MSTATVLRNKLAGFYCADPIGEPPFAVNLGAHEKSKPLNDSQVAAARSLPGFGSAVELFEVVVPDAPAPASAPSPVATPAAKSAAKAAAAPLALNETHKKNDLEA